MALPDLQSDIGRGKGELIQLNLDSDMLLDGIWNRIELDIWTSQNIV